MVLGRSTSSAKKTKTINEKGGGCWSSSGGFFVRKKGKVATLHLLVGEGGSPGEEEIVV